jgi:glycosyltransferase involved in cell wall biosynthesis
VTATATLVSVVIPCWNAGASIAETIESVLAQSGVDAEIVLVDDGSDDDSAEIARAAAGPALRILRQRNLGVSRAREAGTRAAGGSFIQYLDADDVLEPDTLRARFDALSRTNADVAYCDWIRWCRQPDGAFAGADVVARTLGDRPDVELLVDAWWPPGAVLYRRTIVDRIGGWRDDLPVIQDARFLLDAALQGGRFVHVDAVGMKYRVAGDESVSRRDPRAFHDDCYRNAADLHASWAEGGQLDEARRRALVSVYAYLARAFFELDRARFRDVVLRLQQLEPQFVPERPPALRALSRLMGYPAAEHLAKAWRDLKTWAPSI